MRTTQTLSQPPTLDFVKPSRRTRQHTPLCSPEHSRTKRSTCTGSRRNARKAARALQRPAWLNSKRRNPVHQRTEKRETEGEGGEEGEEIKTQNPHCSSVSCQHCAQLWACLLFYKHMALWTFLLEPWAGSDLGLHCFCYRGVVAPIEALLQAVLSLPANTSRLPLSLVQSRETTGRPLRRVWNTTSFTSVKSTQWILYSQLHEMNKTLFIATH